MARNFSKQMKNLSITWTKPNLKDEIGEYFENNVTKKYLKELGISFETDKELISYLEKGGKLVTITKDELIENYDNLTMTEYDFEEELKDQEYSASFKLMEKQLKKNSTITLPAPIILLLDGTYYGFAGNRRMNLAFKYDIQLKVWLVEDKIEKLAKEIIASNWNLFLDDERMPKDNSRTWTIARSTEEAKKLVLERGVPGYTSFDHDLSGEDIALDFVKWMIDQDLDGKLKIPEDFRFNVHSANPVGAKNIQKLLDGYLEFRKK